MKETEEQFDIRDPISHAHYLAKKYCTDYTYHHVELVVGLCEELMQTYECDEEVVLISAWLHDIGRYDMDNKEHPKRSVELAEELLKDHPKQAAIKNCILHHSGRYVDENNPIEVKILQCADGLSFYYNDERIEESKRDGKYEKRVAKTMKKASVLPEGKKRAEEQLKHILEFI